LSSFGKAETGQLILLGGLSPPNPPSGKRLFEICFAPTGSKVAPTPQKRERPKKYTKIQNKEKIKKKNCKNKEIIDKIIEQKKYEVQK
jgi:hypothetical protein